MRPHAQHGRWGPASWLALLPLCLFMVFGLAACSGGGGGGVSGGAATVRGVVVTFEDGQSAFYSPLDVEDLGFVPKWLTLLSRIEPAHAGEGGVAVRVEGTDLAGTTDSEGFFIISGVPPGDQVLTFSRNGSSSSLGVSVPANSSIDLGNVRVSGGQATPGNISVEIFDDDGADGAESSLEGDDGETEGEGDDGPEDPEDGEDGPEDEDDSTDDPPEDSDSTSS